MSREGVERRILYGGKAGWLVGWMREGIGRKGCRMRKSGEDILAKTSDETV